MINDLLEFDQCDGGGQNMNKHYRTGKRRECIVGSKLQCSSRGKIEQSIGYAN